MKGLYIQLGVSPFLWSLGYYHSRDFQMIDIHAGPVYIGVGYGDP